MNSIRLIGINRWLFLAAHNLICVMSEKTDSKAQYPEHLCDFIVYMDLTYNGRNDTLMPKNNGAFIKMPFKQSVQVRRFLAD